MRLVRIPEACDRLCVSKPTLYELIANGELIAIHIGRARRVSDSSIDEYIQRKIDQETDRVAS